MSFFLRYSRLLLLPGIALIGCGCKDAKPQPMPLPRKPLPTKQADVPTYSGENAWMHCAALCELGPRPTGSPAYARQLAYLTRHLRQAGWQVRTEDFAPLPGRRMQNLHATWGDAPQPRPLLLSCHIDTKGQGAKAILGADDGASGAAALLELARALSREPELAARVEIVFFDGEEAFAERMSDSDGLYGSRHDVARRGDQLPRWMINLDMVGGAGKTIGVPLMDTAQEMIEHYDRAIRTLGLSQERWSYYFGSYLDDHRPFAEAGVPSLNLIASFKGASWWHTQKDDMSRISPDSLEETGRVVMQLIRQLLGD